MAAANISKCVAKDAVIHLAPEALLTRAALTAETLAQRYPAVTLRAGEGRLAQLTAALRGLEVRPASVARFDPRMLITIHCEDGGTITILGSATQPDGTSHLSINGEVIATTSAFRREIDGLVGRH